MQQAHPYLKGALGVAAMAAARTKGTYLAAEHRRIATRRGPLKAVAVEHAILIAIWHMLTEQAPYADPGADYYARLNPDETLNRALDQLRAIGYDVTLTPRAATDPLHQ